MAACCLSPEVIKNLEQKFRPDLPKPVPKTIPEIKRVQNILNDTLKALQTNNVSKALKSLKEAEVLVLVDLVVPANIKLANTTLGIGNFSSSIILLNNTRALLSKYINDIKTISQGNISNLANISKLSKSLDLESSQSLSNIPGLSITEPRTEQNGRTTSQSGNQESDQRRASTSTSTIPESESDSRQGFDIHRRNS